MVDPNAPERGARAGFRARSWKTVKRKAARDDDDGDQSPGTLFRIVSYNVLADSNVKAHARSLYRVGAHRLDWNNRSRAIASELGCLNGDVVCLQEFEDVAGAVGERLSRGGYAAGPHARRRGGKKDACAIFYRKTMFVEVEAVEIQFSDAGLGDNVACATVLRHASGGDAPRLVLVANAHLVFNPKRGDLKLGQCRHLFDRVHALKTAYTEKGFEVHTVIAGDWNFNPGSALYNFFADGDIDLMFESRRKLSGAIDDGGEASDDDASELNIIADISDDVSEDPNDAGEKLASDVLRRGWNLENLALALGSRRVPVPSTSDKNVRTPRGHQGHSVEDAITSIRRMMLTTVNRLMIAHPFAGDLQSAYRVVEGAEPRFTTCHAKFVGTNDYIWFTSGLTPMRALRCPNLDDILQYHRLPSVRYPSDHVSLAVDFSFVRGSSSLSRP